MCTSSHVFLESSLERFCLKSDLRFGGETLNRKLIQNSKLPYEDTFMLLLSLEMMFYNVLIMFTKFSSTAPKAR